jgi:hypothetical protein
MRGQQVVVDHSGIAMTRATSITVGAASVYGVGLASPDPASHAMFTTFSLACIAGYYTVSALAAPALPPLRARRPGFAALARSPPLPSSVRLGVAVWGARWVWGRALAA